MLKGLNLLSLGMFHGSSYREGQKADRREVSALNIVENPLPKHHLITVAEE